MDIRQFNEAAKRSETNDEVIFDVRPFGSGQGEAIDAYLHEAVASIGYGVSTFGSKLIVFLHDTTADIPQSAQQWLAELAASGVAVELRAS